MYLVLFSAPPPPKQKEEQAEDSFPRPLPPPLVNPEFKKRESAEVLRNLCPQNIVSAKLSPFP